MLNLNTICHLMLNVMIKSSQSLWPLMWHGLRTSNSKCPLRYLHYIFLCTKCKSPKKDPHGAWLLAWMWAVDMLLKLNGLFSYQPIHLWDTTIPYCLSVMHMSLWLCVFVIIRRDHRIAIGQNSLPFALAFVFHPHPTVAYCLHFVSMAWTSRLQESFEILHKHSYILSLLLFLSP